MYVPHKCSDEGIWRSIYGKTLSVSINSVISYKVFECLLHIYSVWETYGAQVLVNTDDITTRAGCERLFKAALTLGPIGGIFNLAVLLRDSILENQTVDKFVECMAPKALATKYLGTYLPIIFSTSFAR